MKFLIGLTLIACSISTVSYPQSPAKIHLLNPMNSERVELKTTLNQRKPIVIKSHTWVVIRPVSDSLGFIVNGHPHFLHFEPNKQYYFIVQYSNGSSPIITEKSEREFILTAAIYSVKGPEEYELTKVNY
jgi:hypothetical protein